MPAFGHLFPFYLFIFERCRQSQGPEGFVIKRMGDLQGLAGHPFSVRMILMSTHHAVAVFSLPLWKEANPSGLPGFCYVNWIGPDFVGAGS